MMTKLLFICSRNEIRSLTAERLFDGSLPWPTGRLTQRINATGMKHLRSLYL